MVVVCSRSQSSPPAHRVLPQRPSTLLTLAGGALGAVSTRLMHPWVTSGVGAGDSTAPPPNTLPCVGVMGQNWRPSNIVQSLEPFKWSVTWSL